MLEIKNLTVQIDDKTHPQRPQPHREDRRGRRHHGAERLRQVDAVLRHRRQGRTTRSSTARSCSTARTCSTMEPDERAAAGVFLAFQYPLEIPGVGTMTFLKAALNAQRKARGEAELTTPEFIKRVNAAAASLEIPKDMLKRALNVGFSGGEKKRMEILQMALLRAVLLHPRRDRFRARHRRAAGSSPTASTRCARRTAPSSSSPTTSASSTTSCPTACTSWRTAASCAPAGPELALELEANGYAEYRLQAAE